MNHRPLEPSSLRINATISCFLPNTLAWFCHSPAKAKSYSPSPQPLPKLVLQDLKQTLVSSEKHIPRARPSHQCCGSCQLGPALSSPKQPANKNLFIALQSDVTLCFLSTGGSWQPNGETQMLQSKLFDQSLLSEDKNDPSPNVGNATWRPSERCSDWRVSASLVILFKVKDHVHSLVISKVRLKGKRASAIYSERTRPGVTPTLFI